MSKPIKVEDHVYQELDKLKVKGQTFSTVVEALLNTRMQVLELLSVLEGAVGYHSWRDERLRELESADAVRRDVEARTIPRPELR